MKKLLSVIVTIAMLISCVAPALTVGAESAAAIVLDGASFDPASRENTVSANVAIANNPGIAYTNLLLYYNATEVEIAEGAVTSALGEDFALTAVYGCLSTARAYKSAFTAAGITPSADIYCVDITLESAVNYAEDGDILDVIFTIVKDKAEIAEGDTFEYGVIVTAAEDADYIAIDLANASAVLTAAADPNAPKYEDKNFDEFTLYADSVTVNKGTESVEIGFGIGGTNELFEAYGLWAASYMIIYPKELTLLSQRNGGIFDESAGGLEVLSVHDLATWTPNVEAINLFNSIGYDYENSDDYVVSVLFAPDDPYAQMKNTGVMSYATFQLPDAAGTYDILIAADEVSLTCSTYEDATAVPELLNVPFAIDNGSVSIVVDASSCDHANVTVANSVAPTCTDAGVKYLVCGDCGTDLGTEVVPALGHKAGEAQVVTKPTTTTPGKYVVNCTVCGEVVEEGEIPVITETTIKVGSASAKYGKSVNVPVYVENNAGMFIAIFDVAYDPDLVYEGFKLGDVFGADAYVYATEVDGGIHVYIENKDVVDASDDGVIGYLTFGIPADNSLVGKEYNVSVSVEADNIIGTNGEAVDCIVENGSVTVLSREAVNVGSASVKYGGDVKVPVEVVDNTGFFIGTFEIEFDYENIDFIGFELGDVLTTKDYVIANEYEHGKVILYIEAGANADITASGVLGNLVFRTHSDRNLANSSHPVTITAVEDGVINYAGETVDFAYNSGSVEILDREVIEGLPMSVEKMHTTIVPLTVRNNSGFWAARLELVYDPSCLELVGIRSGAFEVAEGINYSVADGVITVFIEYAELENYTLSGDNIFLPEFKALVEGKHEVAINIVEIIDANGADCTDFASIAGSVEVTACQHGETYTEVTKAPTALEEGIETTYCSYCNEVVAENAIAKLAAVVIGNTDITKAGEAVSVPVSLSSNKGVWALGLEIAYDASVLTFVDVEGGLFNATADNASAKDGIITVFVDAATMENITEDGVAFYINFVIADTAEDGVATLSAVVTDNTIDVDGNAVAFETIDGSVAIEAVIRHNLVYVPAVEATCHQNGMAEYWYCTDCEAVFADADARYLTNRKNLTILATYELVYVAAVEATCHQNGSAEYWYCPECDAVFADAAGTQLTNRKNLTIPAAPLTYVPAVEATCHQNGMAEYWYCEECDAVFADAAGVVLTNRKNLVVLATYELVHVEAVEVGCHQNGSAEYWYCPECDAVFADAAGTQLTNRKNLTIAAPALYYSAAVESTCHQDGVAEYWYCGECDAIFADAAGTILTNRKNLTIPAADLIYVPAVEVGCHQNGSAEYWYCAECDAVFADAAGRVLTNRKNLTIPAAPLTYVPAVEATCSSDGMAEYWYCETCDAVFADAAGIVLTNRKNLTIPAGDHKLGGAEVIVPPTLTENGIKVLYCEYCGEAYAEVEMAPVITNYIPGFFAESVEFVGTTIKVVSKVSAPEVDFAPIVAAGCTVELLEGDVEVVMDGTIPYFRSQYGVTAYSIKVTDADGAVVVYDVEVLYKEAPLTNESVLAGWAVDLYEVDANNDHITVYGIPFANTLDFALNIPGIAQDAIKLYNANGEEVAGIFDGGWQYLCANINDGLVQEFVAKVTTPGGVREISITYKFTTKTYFHDVEAGFFAADVKRAGDTVWLTAKEGAPEVDFRVFVAEWDAVVTSDDFEVITTGGFYPRAQRADGEYQEGTITITHTDGTYETFKVIVQF